MTLVDMIQIWDMEHGIELNDLETFFDDIVLDSRLDKPTLVDTLLDYCGAMNVLYNTTGVFKRYTENFFKKYQWNIGKLCDTLHYEYDPLKNKNVTSKVTTKIEQTLDTEESAGEGRIKENTGTKTDEYEYGDENKISAMNSSDYEPSGENTGSGESTTTDDLREEIAVAKSRAKGENLQWDETDEHEESGTEGIFQDLIEKERKISQFNIYEWIANKYAKELFLLVY